jgi:hypothetical protein
MTGSSNLTVNGAGTNIVKGDIVLDNRTVMTGPSTTTGYLTQYWSATNGQGTVNFPTAFGDANWILGGYGFSEDITTLTEGTGTNINFAAITRTATSFVPKCSMPFGGIFTNIQGSAIGLRP